MSFEPTILIRKSSIESKRTVIYENMYSPSEKFKSKGRSKKQREKENAGIEDAFHYLNDVVDFGGVKFPEIELIIIYPETTSFNGYVRQLLDMLEIDYRIDV